MTERPMPGPDTGPLAPELPAPELPAPDPLDHLITQYKENPKDAIYQQILDHLHHFHLRVLKPFHYKRTSHYRALDDQDLWQELQIYLLYIIRVWQPDRGAKFFTYYWNSNPTAYLKTRVVPRYRHIKINHRHQHLNLPEHRPLYSILEVPENSRHHLEFQTIDEHEYIECGKQAGFISDREHEIIHKILRGHQRKELVKEYGITGERIRQLLVNATTRLVQKTKKGTRFQGGKVPLRFINRKPANQKPNP